MNVHVAKIKPRAALRKWLPILALAVGLIGLLLTLLPRLFHSREQVAAIEPDFYRHDRSGLLQIDTVPSGNLPARKPLFSVRRELDTAVASGEITASAAPNVPVVLHTVERISTDSAFPPNQTVPISVLDTIRPLNRLSPIP
jgi:hypothetical protein